MSIVEQIFPWETLTTIIGGRSAIDVPSLQVDDLRQAEGFLDCYGFRWDVPHHRQELSVIRRQALDFIVNELLSDEPGLAMHDDVAGEDDVRQLLLYASCSMADPRQRWACALLRVMHTLAHGSSYFNERFGPEIRAQVLRRIETHLVRDDDGTVWLGRGDDAVPLVDFKVKHRKSTQSIALKLLQKPENVASDIFDRLGFRFVTRERFDCLRVVRYLRVHNVVMFANIKPSRSRNSLVELDDLRTELDRLDALPDISQDQALEEVRRWLAAQPLPPASTRFNPFSSVDYHAIQFTCRQLIRVPNPFAHREGLPPTDERGEAAKLFSSGPELRFFFPFEVQILDHVGFIRSRTGLAAHDVYKARQRETVKRRVLGPLLDR